MAGAFSETSGFDRRVLESLRVGLRRYDPPLGSYAAGQMEIVRQLEDMAFELRTYVLADQLGEETISEVRRQDHECLRFASWWDHWKATYRGRWWMRWRRWSVAYSIENHPLTARVDIDMKRYWAYPKADIPIPEMGEPVRWLEAQRRAQRYQSEPVTWSRRTDAGTERNA